jgi:hypothetical protein
MTQLAWLRQLAKSARTPPAADRALLEATALMQAEMLARRNDALDVRSLDDVEFRVFSQFGDDGILQYLTRKLAPRPSFAEMAAANYGEASTRLLLVKDNWRGLIVDSSDDNMGAVRASELYWRHDLTAVTSFVTAENANALLADHGFTGEIGVLILDIDGNDYWVWEALDAVTPLIVGVEYNSVFGPDRSVVVPYDASFYRTRAHPSNLYWGASIAALANLARRRGYVLVGSNSAGNNAYFVRADAAEGLPAPTPANAWRESRFREARDASGSLTFLAGEARLAAFADMPVLDVETGERIAAGDLLTAL